MLLWHCQARRVPKGVLEVLPRRGARTQRSVHDTIFGQTSSEVKILNASNITAEQIETSLLAIPAFIPATVCTGYLAAWFTNLHDFRHRSLVERIFWSIPLSMGISTIAAVLIGKFISLTAVAVLFVACWLLCLAVLCSEWIRIVRNHGRLRIGWRPLGGIALFLAAAWIAIAFASLIDWQVDHQLFMSLTIFDHAPRVSWTESVLRTGVPPNNPLYWYTRSAGMRTYYFWYVICAAVTRMSFQPVRAVFIASCVWSGYSLMAIIGLFLKYFLDVGLRLRQQVLRCASLLAVTGLGIGVNLWNIFHHQSLFIEVWPAGQTTSWFDTLLYDPHHIAALVCCMFAFLLAGIDAPTNGAQRTAKVIFISASLASAFGLSIYVTFAFFLIVLLWALWHLLFEHRVSSLVFLGMGGGGAALLLIPYLIELTRTSSKLENGSLFAFSVRETLPSDFLMKSGFFSHLAVGHPFAALSLARFLLLTPGYFVELGFYLLVFLTCLVPILRGRAPLTRHQRSLLFLAAAALIVMSTLQSGVLVTNDFGWRASLLFLFPMLLLGSEVVMAWSSKRVEAKGTSEAIGLFRSTPGWLRSATALALLFGTFTTGLQALILRFNIPIVQMNLRRTHQPDAGRLPHNAYISAIGYAKLDQVIPRDAIVQFNVADHGIYANSSDLLGSDHQMALASDQLGCGSELGGDPIGCPPLSAAIDSLYRSSTAEQARSTCNQYGIQYLVARIYDPIWKDQTSWVWTLKPVVADKEFRALDCRQ